MKKIASLFILIAIAGLVSINSYAHSFEHYGFGGFSPFGYGYGFGGFGYGMDYAAFGGFGHEMDFGGFGHEMDFGGFGHEMDFGGFGHEMDFGGFGHIFAGFDGFNHSFTAHTAVPNSIRKIVPIPATASATNTSITYDEDGNIHVRPFDDEDLFVED